MTMRYFYECPGEDDDGRSVTYREFHDSIENIKEELTNSTYQDLTSTKIFYCLEISNREEFDKEIEELRRPIIIEREKKLKELHDQFEAKKRINEEEIDRREYKRLKAKFDPS